MKLILIFATLTISASAGASGFTPGCPELMNELESMRKAQQALMLSLANNHETFATVIEETSTQLEQSGKPVPKVVLQNMTRTAKAFRERGMKAKNQVELLNQATEDVIAEVSLCLKRVPPIPPPPSMTLLPETLAPFAPAKLQQ